MIHPVILAGGAGARLWPVSRKSYPKQFANLIEGQSLFQRTVQRVTGSGLAAPVVVTGEQYRFIAQQQLKDINAAPADLVVEPLGRNTAAAVLTAALLRQDDPEALLLILPSDQMIADERAFRKILTRAARAAETGAIVTFAVPLTHASQGTVFLTDNHGDDTGLKIMQVTEHAEAAGDADTLARDSWLRASGMYLARVDRVLNVFQAHVPEMIAPVEAALALGEQDLGFRRLAADPFARCPEMAFDQAILTQLTDGLAFELTCGWSDLGSWNALKNHEEKDDKANVTAGNATTIDCEGTLLKSENPDTRLVGLGLKDIVAVATDDGILVTDVSRSGEVADVVRTLRAEGAPQADGFRRSHRPWGYYETLSLGDRFQVKRIMVEPGAKLSLQSHVHRAEHWIVVSGSALVTVGEEVRLISENESTFIPLGAIHRLENPGKLPLHLIEVQSGCYLGEDDIVRYEDVYERTEVA